jgi:hypothetical protein
MDHKVDYIFCINTGRCGSNYLFHIFSKADNCIAVHEPPPICNKLPMQAFLDGDEAPIRALMPAKIEQIKRTRGDASQYIETNHCFIKGFGWFVPEHIPPERIGIIILRREKDKVVESYWRIETTPVSERGRKWLISPKRKNPILPPPFRWVSPRFTMSVMRWLALPFRGKKWFRMLHIPRPPVPAWLERFERAALDWYVDETYALGEAYQQKFPGIRYYPVTVEELNDPAKVKEMLDFFGSSYSAGIDEIVGRPTNLKVADRKAVQGAKQ